MQKQKTDHLFSLKFFVIVFPFLLGGFYVYTSVIATVYLAFFLFFQVKNSGDILLKVNITFVSICIISLSFLVSCFWAVDKGIAFTGFIKFLPLLLFSLAVSQINLTERKNILKKLPISGCVMTVISFGLHFFEALKPYFTVAGRLSGFFQYSNTFAVFLICCLVVCAYYEKRTISLLVESSILIFGIFESGSRIAFAVLLLTVLIVVITAENKKVKYGLFIVLILGILASIIYVAVTGNLYTVGRFLTISLNESTLLGRLLYYCDAFPIILKHPFGLGYMGYYFTQSEFQTGVYSVMFIHNELLQTALDIGWIPAGLLIVSAFCSIFSDKTDTCEKVLIFTVFAHAFFDFDFQYISIPFILLLSADNDSGKSYEIKPKFLGVVIAFVTIVLGSTWVGASDLFNYLNMDNIACDIYPLNTFSQIELVSNCKTAYEQKVLSEELIKHNSHIPLAYSSVANYFLAEGDIQKYIDYEKHALELSPYDNKLIARYSQNLVGIHKKYLQMGDTYSADYCLGELNRLYSFLDEVNKRTSVLASKIKDKPNTDLPKDVTEYINLYKEENKK